MKLSKTLLIFTFFIQIVIAQETKLTNFASTIATPFYNVYNQNVIELLEQYINTNQEIEAIKLYDTLIDKTSIIYYEKNGKKVFQIDKEFPKELTLPTRKHSADIIKNGKKIGIITIYYKNMLGKEFLTKKQSKYLNNKQYIKMCVDPDWLPFEKIENGKHIGIAADIIKIIEKKLNIPITLVDTDNWQKSLEYAKKRKCDIFPLASKTPSREEYMNFTTGYFEPPIVIATKINVPFINNILEISSQKLGVVKGYSLHEKFKEKYPNVRLIEVNSLEEGLKQVEKGEIFGYLDNSIVLNHKIQREYVGTLTISGKLDERVQLSIATRNDEPELYNIFQKAVNSITPSQKDHIYKKWVSTKIEKIKVIDYSLVYKVVVIAIIIILIFIYWNRRITKANKALELAKIEIEKLAVTDKLTNLYNRVKLDELLKNEIQRSNRYKHETVFCIFDVDYFKAINDNYGHLIGDQVLIEMAQLIKNSIRETDYLGRWGGEEFLLILPETTKEDGLKLLEVLRQKIENYKFTDVDTQTVSFGVTVNQKEDTLEGIIKRADNALYEAKRAGRNTIVFKT